MAGHALSDEDAVAAIQAAQEYGSVVAAAAAKRMPRSTLQSRVNTARERGLDTPGSQKTIYMHTAPFVADEIPEELPPIEDLISRREDNWNRKNKTETAKKLVGVKVTTEGPIGIMLFGDIHIDDQGMNFPLFKEHLELAQTEGMLAIWVGDLQNSWIGRLGHLYADQSTTAREALALMEWAIEEIGDRLIAIIEGNHDLWAKGINRKSPIEWIRDRGRFISDEHGLRLGLRLPSGGEYIINCRHDFAGRSQWNPAHGVAKAAHLGWKDDVLIAGHTHVSGYNLLKDPASGKVSHALRIASYKHWDSFAASKGFPDQNIFECPTLIIDPERKDDRHRVQVVLDPAEAAEYLTWKRDKWKAREGAT